MLERVSVFHKEVEERKVVKEDVTFKVFMAAYWVIIEEISNRKFSSLVELVTLLGLDYMKHFQCTAQASIREMFLALGAALQDKLLEKVKKAHCFGLLSDEVTDVSVLEMLITFIQYFDHKTGNVETRFLFVENVLKTPHQ